MVIIYTVKVKLYTNLKMRLYTAMYFLSRGKNLTRLKLIPLLCCKARKAIQQKEKQATEKLNHRMFFSGFAGQILRHLRMQWSFSSFSLGSEMSFVRMGRFYSPLRSASQQSTCTTT